MRPLVRSKLHTFLVLLVLVTRLYPDACENGAVGGNFKGYGAAKESCRGADRIHGVKLAQIIAQWNKPNGEADMVLRINFKFIIYFLVNFIAVIYPSAFEI